MKNQNNQLLKLWFLQATETLCHLSFTDIKKRFCNIWFFCKNEACVNCGKESATTLTWLLVGMLSYVVCNCHIPSEASCSYFSINCPYSIKRLVGTIFDILLTGEKNRRIFFFIRWKKSFRQKIKSETPYRPQLYIES